MGESMAERAATVMEHAAEMLETGELAWIQNRLKDYTYESGGAIKEVVGACLIGSIDHAIEKLYGRQWKAHIYPKTEPALEKVTGRKILARWNDALDRTMPEVVDALKQAAKDLRNSANSG